MGKRRKNRKPKIAQQPTGIRSPRVAEKVEEARRPRFVSDVEQDTAKPTWRLATMDNDGPFGWGRITRERLIDVQARLSHFESMTWHEILIVGKKFNHTVTVEQMSKAAQDRLVEIKMDDVDELVSLRVNARERVWGIRTGGLCSVLWWDPAHAVCPSKKKRT